MTLSTLQELPNRVNTALGNATRGSSTGSDTNDPLFLDHNGSNYVYLPGVASNYLSVPDAAALDIVGDLDLRAEIALTTLASGTQTLVAKWTATGNQRSYFFYVNGSGIPVLSWSTDGTATTTATGTAALSTITTDGTNIWIRATLDVDNGASDADAKFWTSTDGTNWTQLGSTVNPGATTSVFAGTSVLEVGSRDSGTNPAKGILNRAQIYDGIDGTLVLDINPATDIDTSADADAGQATFTCTTGQTVTANRSTSGLTTTVVTRPVMCFDGSDDYLQLPATDTPTYSLASGKYTFVVLARTFNTSAFGRLFSPEGSLNRGTNMQLNATTAFTYHTDGVSTVSASRTFAFGALTVFAGVIDDGDIYAYTSSNGLSGATSIAGLVAEPSFASPRAGTKAYDVSNKYVGEMFSVLVFNDVALTEAQLDTLSTKLINGDYS